MKNVKNHTRYIVTGAVIAALYALLTFLSNIFGLAYGPIQFRVSEALTILPIFTPAAIPGIAIGCLISNIFSFNAVDMIFGTFASLSAAVLTRKFRNIKFFEIPLLSFLPPVIINALAVGAEITLFYLDGTPSLAAFLISALQVGLGEAAVCFILGVPLYLNLKNKHNLF